METFLSEVGDAVVGWAAKPSGAQARAIAVQEKRRCLLLEDGFLQSVDRSQSKLSMVVDDLGIYYDATRPSRLERLVPSSLDDAQEARVRALMILWRDGRVSKYNHARDEHRPIRKPFVLVVDQTFGDASVAGGLADPETFTRMLDSACTENPEATVVVKTHPDVFTRKKRGYFDPGKVAARPQVLVLPDDCHPAGLIETAEAVYVVTSQMGFEALIWGKRVRCFGMPFYAGWGLTVDDLPAPERRRGQATLEQLAHAAFVGYSRYVDPETGRRCEIEPAIAYVVFQRRMRARFAADVDVLGFSLWKRPILKQFVAGSTLRFAQTASDIQPGSTVMVWGGETVSDLPADAKVVRVEDGFLRSVGLGADLTQPLSWVCDDEGIYYDASRPSRLETLLEHTTFDPSLTDRARRLREQLLSAGLTKYNIQAQSVDGRWTRPDTGQRVILVPGQIEEDASIRFGAPAIKTNIDLLRAVRRANPQAYVVYKPHPDVIAGLRAAGKNDSHADDVCDLRLIGGDMAQLLGQVDEVHTLTSLTGFEALIRNVAVTCYGLPFYAGWGLTTDIVPIGRRQRRLTLDELVAGTLIVYPTYVSRRTGHFTTPEQATQELIEWRGNPGAGVRKRRRMLRPVARLLKTMATYGRSLRRV